MLIASEATPRVSGLGDFQKRCHGTKKCVIGENVPVQIDGSLKRQFLMVKNVGIVWRNDRTQTVI